MRLHRLIAAAAAVAAGLITAVPASAAEPVGPDRQHRVTLAESAIQGVHGVSPDATVRNLLTVTAPGTSLRVRLSNEFGKAPMRVDAAWVGRSAAEDTPAVVPGTNHRASFGGSTAVTIPAGGSVWSDPVPLRVRSLDQVAISVHAPGAPVNDHTFPPPAAYTPGSFLAKAPGDSGGDEDGASFGAFRAGTLWWADAVSGISPARRTLVTLGDSITDGYNAFGGGPRWTDVLTQRIAELPPGHRLSVANAGISGNTVSDQPNPYDPTGMCCGAPAVKRFDGDVTALPGAEAVLLLEGTNDIGGGVNAKPASAEQVIGSMRDLARRSHEAGLRIIGATVLPMCNAAGSSKEAIRTAVNTWIRTSGTFDEVLDFDAVLRDPNNPTVIRAEWRNDCYHPNAAGDAVLGRSIPLDALGIAS